MEVIKGYTLNKEETEACLELVQKMRAERRHEQAIKEQETQIGAAIEIAISVIGLEETKRIMRRITRALRETEKVEEFPF